MKTDTPDLAFSHALQAENLESYEPLVPSLRITLRRFFELGFALGQMSGGNAVLKSVALFEVEAEEGQPQFIGKILTSSLLPEVSNGGCQG